MRSCPLTVVALFAFLAATVSSCGKEPAPLEPPAPSGTAAAPAEPAEPAKPARKRPQPRAEPVAPPSGATVGEVAPAVPRPAPKLFDGVTSAAALPDVNCEDLATEKGYTLARKVEVLSPPAGKGEAVRTLELCQFNRWLKRTDDEIGQRTGRRHLFVAAFPGAKVASWTSPEIERRDVVLGEPEAVGLAAGWAALIPTGVPQWPAIAVTSARFYAGPLGEKVHYLRRARVLIEKAGRWTWSPLHERAFGTLDVAWLKGRCEGDENAARPACQQAAATIAADAKAAGAREGLRKRRLAGKSDPGTKPPRKRGKLRLKLKAYKEDADPQGAWLRDGRLALAAGDTKLALRAALRMHAVCGEPVEEADTLIRAALKKAKLKAPTIRPPNKLATICEPLADKAPPKERKR